MFAIGDVKAGPVKRVPRREGQGSGRDRRLVGPREGWAMTQRTVNLTSPDRVLFPEDGVTKGDVFEYYREVGSTLAPHLRDRPFTMKRYPHGINGEVFFQKQAPRGMPDWIPTRRFTTHPRDVGSREVHFPLMNSPEAVLWMVQMNCV